MTTVVNNAEKRAHRRINPGRHILIKNFITDDAIGQVVNLSQSGLMLSSRNELRQHQIFQTSLWLDSRIKIMVGIENLWVDRRQSGMTLAGYMIIDVSAQDQQTLIDFIEHHP